MDNQNIAPQQRQRIHPLVATAAGAVIVASLAATAAITGILPKAGGDVPPNPAPQALQSQAPAAAAATSAAPANTGYAAPAQASVAPQTPARPIVHHRHAAQAPSYTQQAQPAPSYAPQPAYCQSCGTVVAIDAARTPGQSTGIGAIGGAAAGGLLGNQFGRGNGRTAMTIIGALGGGLAGNSVEQQVSSQTDYQVQVQMESGATRTFTYHSAPPFAQGQRVRIENGTLVGA